MNRAPRIAGVLAVALRQICDERGAVLHMIRADAPDFQVFGECYFSEVAVGAVKAWKRHRLQTQNLAVPIGRVRFVIYDDRAGSPTRDRVDVFELGRPDAYLRLRIPPMLWYGFACMGDTVSLVANVVDMPHDPAESEMRGLGELGPGEALRALTDGMVAR